MATIEQCREALHTLAARLEEHAARRASSITRTLHLSIPDLDAAFHGRLEQGRLVEIADGPAPDAAIRLTIASDDLIALVAGHLDFARAWATGQISLKASMADLFKLRSLL